MPSYLCLVAELRNLQLGTKYCFSICLRTTGLGVTHRANAEYILFHTCAMTSVQVCLFRGMVVSPHSSIDLVV